MCSGFSKDKIKMKLYMQKKNYDDVEVKASETKGRFLPKVLGTLVLGSFLP